MVSLPLKEVYSHICSRSHHWIDEKIVGMQLFRESEETDYLLSFSDLIIVLK